MILVALRVWLVLGLAGTVLDLIVRRRSYAVVFQLYPGIKVVPGLVLGIFAALLLGPIGLVALVNRKRNGISAADAERERALRGLH